MPPRHVPYIPRPDYEQLRGTGLRRYPQCVRTNVTILVPPGMLAWLPFLAHMQMRVLMPAFTVN
jgi:hypothetical protein